ncbi:MAG: [protein-PII] uridylyltransferase, partial [Gammaproteobacteria bacterium]
TLSDEYFLRETPENILWHTTAILNHHPHHDPLVAIQESTPNTGASHQRALQIFTCSPNRPHLFLASVATMEQLGLSIVDARVTTTPQDLSVNTYLVIEPNQQDIPYHNHQLLALQRTLIKSLTHLEQFQYQPSRRIPRELRHFEVATTVHISDEHNGQRTVIEVITLDRPGLLAIIANQFRQFGLDIYSARIATLGERAEDIFVVTEAQGHALKDTRQCDDIRQALNLALDSPSST